VSAGLPVNEEAFVVAGDPSAVRAAAARLSAVAAKLDGTGRALRRLDADGWYGAAGDAYREATSGEPRRWSAAAEGFADAAAALNRHADVLADAQARARDAAAEHARARALTDAAHAAAGAGPFPSDGPHPWRPAVLRQPVADVVDPGAPVRIAALDALASARAAVEYSGERAAATVRAATEAAPGRPNWFSRTVGSFLLGAGE